MSDDKIIQPFDGPTVRANKDVEEVWDEFWKHIVTVEGKGVSLGAIKKELYDYYVVLQNVPKVYMEITGGYMSKPFYDASDVLSRYSDHVEDLVKDAIKEAMEDSE
jgi:hypothetical protein